jgi:hypothetical protein
MQGRTLRQQQPEIEIYLKTVLWKQFGAAIDMLANAMRTCPEGLWHSPISNDPSMPPQFSEFWYVAYHALFWLDLRLSGSVEGFTPPAPFGLEELDPAGVLPARTYSQAELLTYLAHGRSKCQETIEGLTDKKALQLCKFPWGEVSFLEVLLYNMRHVQEHASQLNLFLGQKSTDVPG